MVKLVFCCRRNPDIGVEEFRRYWLEEHGALVRSLRDAFPSMKRYVQSHTIDTPANDAVRASRGSAEPFDGITEVWFDELPSGPSGEEAAAAGRRLLQDESTFLDFAACSIFYTTEHVIF